MNIQIKQWGLPIEFAIECTPKLLSAEGLCVFWKTQEEMWVKLFHHYRAQTLGDIGAREIYDEVTESVRLYIRDVLVLETTTRIAYSMINALNSRAQFAHSKLVQAQHDLEELNGAY